jgi:hypothetical protein
VRCCAVRCCAVALCAGALCAGALVRCVLVRWCAVSICSVILIYALLEKHDGICILNIGEAPCYKFLLAQAAVKRRKSSLKRWIRHHGFLQVTPLGVHMLQRLATRQGSSLLNRKALCVTDNNR